jgi:uncharacterized membrane protein
MGDFETTRAGALIIVVAALVAYYFADRRWGRSDRWGTDKDD